jgi:hypothetical protein
MGGVGQLVLPWTVMEKRLAGTAPGSWGGGMLRVVLLPPPQLAMPNAASRISEKRMQDR